MNNSSSVFELPCLDTELKSKIKKLSKDTLSFWSNIEMRNRIKHEIFGQNEK